MDDLISRKAAIDQAMGRANYVDTIFDKPTESEIVYMLRSIPSVPAVPLDKLCEWLARNAFAFECKDCEEYCRALLECENEVGSDPEYWKNKLIEWMEGLDGIESMAQKT